MNAWLVLAALVMVGAVVATLLATVVRKLSADRQDRRYAAAVEAVRPAVFGFVASEGEEVGPLLDTIRAVGAADARLRRQAANDLLVQYGSKLRGEVVARIREFFTEHGFADEAARDLGDRSAWKRARGAQELGFVGDSRYTPALVRLLQDRDLAVRIVAARALGEIGDAAAAGPLLSSRVGSRPVPYGAASQALLRIGLGGVDALHEALHDRSFRVRRLAIDVLGELGERSARDELVRILRTDGDTIVRIRAARALGRVGTARVLGDLYDSLRSENADIRQSIVRAVADIGARQSLPVLRRALSDTDHASARTAAYALLELGPAGDAILRAAAASPGRESVYAIEALDTVEPVSDEQRARVRQWDPLAVAERSFPTTGRTAR